MLKGCFRSGPMVAALYFMIDSRSLWTRVEKIRFTGNERNGVSAFVSPRRDFGGTGWNNGVLAPVKYEKKISRVKKMDLVALDLILSEW